MEKYDHRKIEEKWREKWQKSGLYKTKEDSKKPKCYVLDMFPYPSGEGLHVGHPKGYIATDVYSRYKQMNGFNILHPMGWDAFGLPAENYAIKNKVHPRVAVEKNIKRYKEQLSILGFNYDWDREINTTDPEYYKWTQWIFLKLLEKGWAYESYEPINWCPVDKTGLANEDVEDGKCERCGATVEKRPMRQWVLRITDYAEKMLKDLDGLDWPESIKESQRNWIGRSEGAEISFKVTSGKLKVDNEIKVFTTRADTLFGVTYLVLAPEHPLIEKIKPTIENSDEVVRYIVQTKQKNEIERTTEKKEKTGVELKGVKALNPANGEEIPVWIADYVLASYGTGAIMAVPAHDERDFEFAKKYKLPIKHVVTDMYDEDYVDDPVIFCNPGEGWLVSSNKFNGLESEQARIEITKAFGKLKITYKLKDWVFSRQRYWGEPIPVIHCEHCNKPNYVLLHGWDEDPSTKFFPYVIKNLKEKGFTVSAPKLPNSPNPQEDEQIKYILKKEKFDENTVLLGHSLGGALALKVLEKIDIKIAGLVLVAGFSSPKLKGDDYPFEKTFNWQFDFRAIKNKVGFIKILSDINDDAVPLEQGRNFKEKLNGELIEQAARKPHFRNEEEPLVLESLLSAIKKTVVPVPEKDLPVELPEVEFYEPTGTGESPLANIEEWVNVKCPKCKGPAKRETNTMPQWAGSSWYYLRYEDPKNKKMLVDPKSEKYWSPVDFYVGGAEHATRHLIYARFWHKFLFDIGVVNYKEPFKKLQNVGLIGGADGRKMSKRYGNVVNPDEMVDLYGADTFRLYEMFMGPFADSIPWSTEGMIGPRRFVERVWRLGEKVNERIEDKKDITVLLQKTIKKVGEDINDFKFNTAISSLMILLNELEKEEKISKDVYSKLILILAPFAPHVAEELWEVYGEKKESVHVHKWPVYDAELIKGESKTIGVQVNGKARAHIKVESDTPDAEIQKMALENVDVKRWTEGKNIKKIIIVKDRIVSIVTE